MKKAERPRISAPTYLVVAISLTFTIVAWGADTETVLYAFQGGTDGARPQAGVVRDAAGNLYGTTAFGGNASCNCGVVFELSPNSWEVGRRLSSTGSPMAATAVFRSEVSHSIRRVISMVRRLREAIWLSVGDPVAAATRRTAECPQAFSFSTAPGIFTHLVTLCRRHNREATGNHRKTTPQPLMTLPL